MASVSLARGPPGAGRTLPASAFLGRGARRRGVGETDGVAASTPPLITVGRKGSYRKSAKRKWCPDVQV
jgi:hypothetical protein